MKRLQLGHIAGYTALTVILTAGAAQSLAGSNSVESDDIIDGAVTSADILNNGIKSKDIKDNSVTGTDVDESTLTLTCPEAAPLVAADVCFQSSDASGTWGSAVLACVALNLRLPTATEAALIDKAIGGEETLRWTDGRFVDGADVRSGLADRLGVTSGAVSTPSPYRCVTSLGAGL